MVDRPIMSRIEGARAKTKEFVTDVSERIGARGLAGSNPGNPGGPLMGRLEEVRGRVRTRLRMAPTSGATRIERVEPPSPERVRLKLMNGVGDESILPPGVPVVKVRAT